jgi:ABC-type multidrug transport system, ATPase and permease components
LETYNRLLNYLTLIRREVLNKVLISVAISATYIIQAITMATVVSAVFIGSDLNKILPYLGVALLMVILRGIFFRIRECYSKVMAIEVKNKIRTMIFDKILHLGPGYLNDKRSGKVQSLVLDGIESLEPFLIDYVPQIISIAISGLAIGIYLATLDSVTGLLIIVAMLLCVAVPYFTLPLVRERFVAYWQAYAELNAQYVDSIQGMTTLKAFHASKIKGRELEANATTFYHEQLNSTTFSLIDSSLMTLLTSIASTITVAVAAYRTGIGIIPVVSVSAFLFLAIECARPMVDLNNYWHNSFLGLSVAKELFKIVDAELTIVNIENANQTNLDEGLPGIEFKDVSFSYRKDAQDAVANMSFSINPGETVAIVGKSGSGKSTIANLLLRFYDTDDGSILINKVDIREYDLNYLLGKIGVVFQDTYLFHGTIAESIAMAKPEAAKEELEKAAQAAGAHEFIMNMPDGYLSRVGERGATLSGGECQRLAITRAILKDAPLLILDEATSSVDAKNEKLIQKTLETLTQNRTTIIIAHRLSTIQNADKIFVLSEGRLVEQGNHEALLKLNGVYSGLINAQIRGEACG